MYCQNLGKRSGQYLQSIEQIAHMQLDGKDVTVKIARAADDYRVIPEVVKGGVYCTRAAWLSTQISHLKQLVAKKAKGIKVTIEDGIRMTIDEAITYQETKVTRYATGL